MSAELKARAREIIQQLDALYNSKRPGGGVHGQVIGMEPWTIRTTGDGLQCVYEAQYLLHELLDPFDRQEAAPAQGALTDALPELPKPIAHIGKFMDECTDVFDQSQMHAYVLADRTNRGQVSDAADADSDEALEILDSLIESIEQHGNYSKESTLGFLGQIRQCLAAIQAQAGDAQQGADHA